MASENPTDYTDGNFLNKEEEDAQSVKKAGKCSILVIGKTGVGKSTLINAVFRESSIATGAGKRITQGIERNTEQESLMIVYDTPGLQLFSGEEIAYIRKQVSQLIAQELINVVWYCISYQGNRIEEIEEDWIRDIDRQRVPIILVLTKAFPEKESAFLQYLKSEKLPVKDVIPVLAQPIDIIANYTEEAHGLKSLVDVTASVLVKEYAKNTFMNAQKVSPLETPPEENRKTYERPPSNKKRLFSFIKNLVLGAGGITALSKLGLVVGLVAALVVGVWQWFKKQKNQD